MACEVRGSSGVCGGVGGLAILKATAGLLDSELDLAIIHCVSHS